LNGVEPSNPPNAPVGGVRGVLLDIDGVLFVGDEPVPGAHEALGALRARADGVALVTNTTTRSRAGIVRHLRRLKFAVQPEQVLTPAATAVATCRENGWSRVALLVADALREDLEGLDDVGLGAPGGLDAVVLADTGHGFDVPTLNGAFRALMDGAQLIVLGHNRHYAQPDGLVMDVGAWSAALEYAAQVEPIVVGKPSGAFFATALETIRIPAHETIMVGDDIEADVGGALDAGLRGVLVRTGKYRADRVPESGVTPTATVDSIADVPGLLSTAPD
jgi:phospholysine phosphohistidine inorganic pyrophosphate phosphatase